MAHRRETSNERKREGLDLLTLGLAALAAVVAAIVTSTFWEKGALISTALTPVIVTLIKDGLRRPAEKVTAQAARVTAAPVRGAAALAPLGARRGDDGEGFDRQGVRVGEERIGGDRPGAGGHAAGNGAGAVPPPLDDTRAYDPGRSRGAEDVSASREDTAPASAAGQRPERTVYGRRRFRFRPKVVLLTALAAFAIAVGMLTIPELVFGGSLASDRGTTLFGGGSETAEPDGDSPDGEVAPSDGSAPAPAPSDSGEPAPAPEESEEPEVAPEEAPEEPAPAPEVPSAPAPSG
jgi:hypothetical protein